MELIFIKEFLGKVSYNIRDYNEDRLSIIYKVLPPTSKKSEVWPEVSFFAVYDGHGGHKCADYLRDNLHNLVNITTKPFFFKDI